MAHHKSAKKRIKTSIKKRARNKQYLSKVRTAVKGFRVAVAAFAKGELDKEKIAADFSTVQSLLAKACRKGVIPKNTASRRTKRLYLLLKKATASDVSVAEA